MFKSLTRSATAGALALGALALAGPAAACSDEASAGAPVLVLSAATDEALPGQGRPPSPGPNNPDGAAY